MKRKTNVPIVAARKPKNRIQRTLFKPEKRRLRRHFIKVIKGLQDSEKS
jgi:hypothetical protein